MRNLIRALRGKPVELSEQQQAKMAEAQARADAIIAEREAAGREAMFNPLDPMQMLPQIRGRKDRPQLGPYCGPA